MRCQGRGAFDASYESAGDIVMRKAMLVLTSFATIAVAAALAPRAARAAELANDGYTEGGSAGFQSGFVAGEIAAARLVGAACPARIRTLRFLFGGSATTRSAVLHIWDDSAQTLAPGEELFATAFQLIPSDTSFQQLDISISGVEVCGTFRVGIEFSGSGAPSVARDTDGTINTTRNFVLGSGLGWATASSLGITGDWVIRADVDAVTPLAVEVANDGYTGGSSAVYLAGFVAGEVAAARLVPTAVPAPIEGVRLLFGGAPGSRDVVLHIWDDAAATLAPGVELFTSTFNLTSSAELQDIDLSAESIVATGPVRIGVELNSDGLPFVARDADGDIHADRNFVLTEGTNWLAALGLGISGDFVIRALIPEPEFGALAAASFATLAGLARRRERRSKS